jgi:hypothetical protein
LTRTRRWFYGWGRGWCNWISAGLASEFIADLLGCGPQRSRLLIQQPLQEVTKIAQQVPTIGHLNGVGSALGGPVGVKASTISADDLNPRMCLEPGRQSRSAALRQQIHEVVLLQIDQDRAIGLAFVFRPIIDPKHTRGGV